MELYLQFGHGMMEHCRTLLTSWGGGTVILSPRDLTDSQLKRLGADIAGVPGGEALLDPQFYLPHADHAKLRTHSYWPNDYETTLFWQGPALSELLRNLQQLNAEVGCSRFILPGLFAPTIDEDWLERQRAIIEEARAIESHKILIPTVALSAEAVQNVDQVTTLIERAESWKARAYYVVCEHPKGQYLVDDANWIANVLDVCAGLRMTGAEVILGYCNQQMLIAGAAKVTAIASGTWMNVRSFPPEKFNAAYDDEIKRRATWYYCPQAFSEYKIQFLDVAHRLGLLHLMAPPAILDGGYVSNLFTGAQPSSVEPGEQGVFRHYLHALHKQAEIMPQDSFDSTVASYKADLSAAETLLERLGAASITGQLRDFTDVIDINRAALAVFSTLRGPVLRRAWNSI